MKINKFNETLAPKKFGTIYNITYSDEKFPFKCKFKNRVPDPGICWITDIDFRNRKLGWSNGAVSSIANFDDVEFIPDIFVFGKFNL